MPRPTKDNNATHQVCFRCTAEQHAELKRLAKIAGVSMSAYLLESALEWAPPVEPEGPCPECGGIFIGVPKHELPRAYMCKVCAFIAPGRKPPVENLPPTEPG